MSDDGFDAESFIEGLEASGGTWAREAALKAAAIVAAGDAVNSRTFTDAKPVLDMATEFEAWLTRDADT
ncbi:hypothetical protein PBI_THONKO_62 [Mycobacterium phage Thonko]|uniref:Uncharacterized protein n=1 Tax=Mycobacterium phage Thonko TaxID=2282910 RepID=A0A346FCA9_9CAUD|nr:hypothetical protein I5G57_gp062 [Mycobacterium phage Thonko]AXN53334.1 hypothetical protein PBI_THONKO_62 [Mycobacterium phage Thonko]